jgi:hypothetical protein
LTGVPAGHLASSVDAQDVIFGNPRCEQNVGLVT